MRAALEDMFERDDAVRIAYLHGSHAAGKADEESDLDIAVLASPSLGAKERFELRFRLMRDVSEALRMPFEKIDLIMLQDVPALLQFNVIRNGMLLFERDRSEKIAYSLHVEQAYDDERYYLDRESDAILSRILSRPTV